MTSVEQLADPVWDLIDAIPAVNTYDAEVPGAPPTDEDGRVHAYAVYYPGPGVLRALDMGATPTDLEWTFQVNCVGGDRTRALWCVGRVRAALTGTWLTVNGQEVQLHETTDPGPVHRDDKVTPPRFWLPLSYAADPA